MIYLNYYEDIMLIMYMVFLRKFQYYVYHWENTPRARSQDIQGMKPLSEESLCENWLYNPVLSQYYSIYSSSSLSGGL